MPSKTESQRQIINSQYAMVHDVYYCPKEERWGHSEEILGPKQDWNHTGETADSGAPYLPSKGFNGSVLLVLLHAMHFSFGWFHSMCTVLLGKVLMVLATLTSWGSQCNSGFTFTTSSNNLWGSPFKEFPALQETSLTFAEAFLDSVI